VPDGQAVVLDVAQLEALLAKTFNVGLDVGRGKEPVALVRLRLAKALIGVAEANALAAESIAIERGVSTEEIAQTEALALHAAAFNGMPDPVFHLTARAMAIVMGLAAVEPDPRAPDNDVLLDAALQAATGVAQLLRFRGACATAQTAAERDAATACLLSAEAELTKAAEAVSGLLELAKISAAPAAPAPRTSAEDAGPPGRAVGAVRVRRPAGVLPWLVMTMSAKEHRMTKPRARQEGRHRRGHHGR
jgi:hypothetical protein